MKSETFLAHVVLWVAVFLLPGCAADGTLREPFWADVDLSAFEALPQSDKVNAAEITPAEKTTYWELRGDRGFVTSGNKCAKADDRESCILEFDALRPSHRNGFLQCGFELCSEYIVSNSGNVNQVWDTLDKLKLFLGPIDSKEDAMLLSRAVGYRWSLNGNKEEGAIRQVDDGYELILLKTVKECSPYQKNRFLLHIHRATATLSVLREQTFFIDQHLCV